MISDRVRTFIQDFARYTAHKGIPPTSRDMLAFASPCITSTSIAMNIITVQAPEYFVQVEGEEGMSRCHRLNTPVIPKNLYDFIPVQQREIDRIIVDAEACGELGDDAIFHAFMGSKNGLYIQGYDETLNRILKGRGQQNAVVTSNPRLIMAGVVADAIVYRPEWLLYEYGKRNV